MVFSLISLPLEAQAEGRTLYVAPWGDDYLENGYEPSPNTFDTPWRTISIAIRRALPGDTIVVRGGTYVEAAGWGAEPGTKSSPIVLTNYKNERVVIEGHLQLAGADYWTVDGIDVTYDPGLGRTESLVKFDGGVGWELINSEIWGTRGVSNLMITGQDSDPRDFRISGNCIHDNLANEDQFMQDHNIYLQPGYDSGPGVIERNILFNAPNGANIKAAGGDPATGAANVLISHNTMSTAGAGVIVGYDSHGISMTGNLIGPPEGGGDLYIAAIIGNTLTGDDNVAKNNAVRSYEKTVWSTDDSTRPVAESESIRVRPDFDNTSDCDGFHPGDEAASAYGRYGHGDYPATGSDSFHDDDGSVFEVDIEWIASQGITHGCNPPLNTMFCPDDPVTRGQMAAFLRRALNLPDSPRDYFVDDSTSTFQADINSLAHAGITQGCNPPTNDSFCPTDNVTRGQMAAFIVRAQEYPSTTTDFFWDDDQSTFEANINSLANEAVTKGCNPPTNDQYCPGEPVLRGQMAAFLARALQG
ncbi:MAG: hypothetical protein ACLFWH_05575 [Actinomycetota bacterium]